jgi:hypothetical protein
VDGDPSTHLPDGIKIKDDPQVAEVLFAGRPLMLTEVRTVCLLYDRNTGQMGL